MKIGKNLNETVVSLEKKVKKQKVTVEDLKVKYADLLKVDLNYKIDCFLLRQKMKRDKMQKQFQNNKLRKK